MKVLVTGISSAIGRMTASLLLQQGHEVFGIDKRPWPDAPRGVEMHRTDIRKRPAEDVFRRARPEAVIHLGTVTQFTTLLEERDRINLDGTRKVFEHCHHYGVKHAVFVGRHTFYGAAPDAPLYHVEDEPPIAMTAFPELSDLVAADLYAGSALWRYPEMTTSVLRTCYTLGPTRQGTLATFLRGPWVPTFLGFDPLFQFVHEQDLVTAITLAVKHRARGVFNVAGPLPLPLSVIIQATGRKNLPIPEPMYGRLLGRFGLPKLPRGAHDHIKFPVIIDDSAFRETTGYAPQFDEVQTMDAFRWAS